MLNETKTSFFFTLFFDRSALTYFRFFKNCMNNLAFLTCHLFILVHIYESKEKGGSTKRVRNAILWANFSISLYKQSTKKFVKKKKERILFFLSKTSIQDHRKKWKNGFRWTFFTILRSFLFSVFSFFSRFLRTKSFFFVFYKK